MTESTGVVNSDALGEEALHSILVSVLEAAATPETAEWFTRYLKGVITYRGVKTPQLKTALKSVFAQSGADRLPADEQLRHIRHWLAQPMAEDKLTAILWLKQWLKRKDPDVTAEDRIAAMLGMVEDALGAGDIHDWSTNDWLCVRVLEEVPLKTPDFIPRLVGWAESETVWQRRCAILAFKKAGKSGLHHDVIADLVQRLLPSEERFVQTGIGWVLADASRKHPEFAAAIFEAHFEQLSHEVIVRHAKYLPNHAELKQRSAQRCGREKSGR
ncbi:MAG: DNA alkylation repair protein [Bradymonadia bacterium]